MPPPIVSNVANAHLRVQVNAEQHSNADAVAALLSSAQTSRPYQKAKANYELRLINSDGNQYLELHKRNALSRVGSFLKGIFTRSRSQNTQARELARTGGAEFYAQHVAGVSSLHKLRQHVRAPAGKDPVATAARDQDIASVKRDIDATMFKVRDYLLKDQEAEARLKGHVTRDAKVYAPFQTLVKKQDAWGLLKKWSPTSWSAANTSAFMMDLGLQMTRDIKGLPPPRSVRGDIGTGNFAKILSNSKQAAINNSLQDSAWVREFLPAQTEVNHGASFSTAKLLQLIDRVPDIQLSETEAVVNGLTNYWDNNIIKQRRGEFHTVAEAWATYNQYLDSERIPRGLNALAPQSAAMIKFLNTSSEGRETLLSVYNEFNRSVAQDGLAASQTKLQEKLKTLEDEFSGRELLVCYLPYLKAGMKLVPDEPRYNDALVQIASNYRQLKQEKNPGKDSLLNLQLVELVSDLPDRQALSVLAARDSFVVALINITPQEAKFDNLIASVRSQWTANMINPTEEGNADLFKQARNDLIDALPAREKIGVFFPDQRKMLKQIPVSPEIDAKLQNIAGNYLQLMKEDQKVLATDLFQNQFKELLFNLPNRNLLAVMEPDLESEIFALPKGATSDPKFASLIEKYKTVHRAVPLDFDESAKISKVLYGALLDLIKKSAASKPPQQSN